MTFSGCEGIKQLKNSYVSNDEKLPIPIKWSIKDVINH